MSGLFVLYLYCNQITNHIMKTITLTILAEDILNSEYQYSDDCAITRALARAGRPDLKDSGLYIQDENGFSVVEADNEVYDDMASTVIAMYRRKRGFENEGSAEIIDREYTIEIRE